MNADTLSPGKLLRALRKLESLISSTSPVNWVRKYLINYSRRFSTFHSEATFRKVSLYTNQQRKHTSPFVATKHRYSSVKRPNSNQRLNFDTKLEQAATMVLPVDNPTKSYWIEAADSPLRNFQSTPRLPKKTDIVIIGSGYTGTTSAYWIHKVSHLLSRKALQRLVSTDTRLIAHSKKWNYSPDADARGARYLWRCNRQKWRSAPTTRILAI